MKFTFYLRNAAYNNCDAARLRESTRMACIARALASLGHSVSFTDVPGVLRNSSRWKFFSGIPVNTSTGGISVSPAEPVSHRYSDVSIKCSVATERDDQVLKHCRLLVAHECNPGLADDERVLHVPFLVFDAVIEDLIAHGLFEAYLGDELEAIRAVLPQEKTGDVGFRGCNWPNRKEFFENAPEWVDAEFYHTPRMGAWEHARWLAGYKAAVALPGDTPKTNLPPLLVMLGIPIIAPEPELNTPPLDDGAMIRFRDWDGVRETLDDPELLRGIVSRADEIYRAGWSPLGIAKQIVGRLE